MADCIPISDAERIVHKYGYDQAIIYARRVGEPGSAEPDLFSIGA